MQNDNVSNNVMPPSAAVRFSFGGADIIRLPVSLFLKLGINIRMMKASDEQYKFLAWFGDKVDAREKPHMSTSRESLPYLQQVPWSEIDPYVLLSPDTRAALADLWSGKGWSGYNVELQSKKLPKELRTQVQLVQTTSSRDEVR